ncbi:MAG: hypothetical protein CBC16_03295 [Verrucomicrobia bacterium TMED56]|jgi:hypothetical protein|nr:MAG: hypothetical protein CBC16_03295 [Verrucomicrobia bacterium TMED56]
MKNFAHIGTTIVLSLVIVQFIGCRKFRSDPSKITMRPRVFIQDSAPVPIIDEYDFTGVQIGTIANIFTDDPKDRTYAFWFSVDRRSAITLQTQSIRRKGQTLQLVIAGKVVGFHYIESAITNGVLPFVLNQNLTEENAMILFNELNQSIIHLRAELEELKG